MNSGVIQFTQGALLGVGAVNLAVMYIQARDRADLHASANRFQETVRDFSMVQAKFLATVEFNKILEEKLDWERKELEEYAAYRIQKAKLHTVPTPQTTFEHPELSVVSSDLLS